MDDDNHTDDADEGAVLETILTIIGAIFLAFLVQAFLIKPFQIPSASMENTLQCGDRILAERISYRFSTPDRFDIVVFNPPEVTSDNGKLDIVYIKRIVGMPGDTIEVQDYRAFVNDEPIEEPFLHPLPNEISLDNPDANWGPYVVKDDEYILLGDNRANSSDSRVFGAVPRDYLLGKAIMAYWPLNRFGTITKQDDGQRSADAINPACQE